MTDVLQALESLVAFAYNRELIGREDLPYARNLLADALRLDAPASAEAYTISEGDVPDTATAFLDILCEDAVRRGVIPGEPAVHSELFAARLMGLLTPAPSALAARFAAIEKERGIEAATAWFYQMCRDANYIRVDDISRNVVFMSPSPAGDLIITINLSKPEKDPKTIALERSQPASSYPKCQLCVENTGYAGRIDFPARQNHRMLPVTLGGGRWHFQFSPFLYYNEHCIILNDQHAPMRIDRDTFEAMFDFVDRFTHYFIGSNADIPIVGGSILVHNHFQGGKMVFPMTNAPIAVPLRAKGCIRAGILDWPLSTVRLISHDRAALCRLADKLLHAWRAWTDEAFGILARTDAPHNAITPLLRRENGEYVLDLVLRNNRTSAEHPLGIFHPHADLHHIKRENIGLIEVMGLFILPGRLLTELSGVQDALSSPARVQLSGDARKHQAWLDDIRSRRGIIAKDGAQDALREELAVKCARVLADCGVYPQTDGGYEGMLRFLRSAGVER